MNRVILCLLLVVGACPLTGASEQALSLSGDWRFEIANADARGFARELPGKIHLPGTIDDAGLGPKNTEPPTLAGPYRLSNYAGPAWYQRDIEIPANWQGKRVTLFLERCRWVTTAWLDDAPFGTCDSLIAPHVHDFGTGIKPGKHRLTILVDNTVKLDLGRFVSALFGGTWGNMNGITGRIELQATPPVWISDVHVYPNLARKTALVKVRIGNATGQAGSDTLKVGSKTVAASWDAKGGQAEVEVDMSGAKIWDEFAPNLTELTVKLGGDQRTVRFGMRDFAAKGTQFALNGRPVSLRGTLECSVWPLTGYPPTDPASWERIYRIIKSYGLNHMRFHSWCPPDAAFEAADQEGVILQVEAPQANVPAGTEPARDDFTAKELLRIVDTYGNHPSFCLLALGNEYGGKDDVLAHWVEMLIQRDPRHLYSSASNNRQRPECRQFTVTPQGRGIPDSGTMRDLRDIVASDTRPVLGHEIGQWMFFPDFNEIQKWKGVMALRNFEMIRDDLDRKHLLDLAPKFVDASGRFAVRLYKEEIEVLLRTPGYGGFALLDLHDYPTQGTALIGPLDPFWESKGFITPEKWRRFCGPTVPLLRMPKRTYVAGETFEASAELAHFGPADLPNAQPVWSIKDEKGREIASGKLPPVNAQTGKLSPLGSIQAPLAKIEAPAKLTVTVSLSGTDFANNWDIWVYPPPSPLLPPAGVSLCAKWDAAKAALSEGKKVLFFAGLTRTQPSLSGRFLPVFWSPVWFPTQKPNTMGLLCDPAHPLFAQFPTESHSDWQWFELMQHSRVFNLDDTPATYRPALQVIDNFSRNQKLGIVFEGRSGPGMLLACGFDLPGLEQDPAARQFLASLYNYVGSAAFQPKQEFSGELLEKLFVPHFANKLEELGARVRASSQHREYPASNAVDGDPNTMWHTPWEGGASGFPHELVIEIPKPAKLYGLTCLPRQDHNRNGWIKDYAVYVSDNGKSWGKPIAQGAFERKDDWKTIRFNQPVETRFVRFVAVSSFDPGKPFASLAELSAIVQP